MHMEITEGEKVIKHNVNEMDNSCLRISIGNAKSLEEDEGACI